jgi:hypothetical protein
VGVVLHPRSFLAAISECRQNKHGAEGSDVRYGWTADRHQGRMCWPDVLPYANISITTAVP